MKNKSCKNYVYVVWKFQTYQHNKYERLDNMSDIIEMTQIHPIYALCFNKSEVNDYLKDNDYYYSITKKFYGNILKLK